MSSLNERGVKFVAYPQDHEPAHVHALVGGIGGPEVIIQLGVGRTVAVARRVDAVRGATQSEVRASLKAAASRFDDLVALWNRMHDDEV